MKEFDFEEEFHAKNKKASRQERKRAQKKDRSKFKKTDQKRTREEPPQDLPRGRVIAIRGEEIFVAFEDKIYSCSLKGSLKHERSKAKNLVAVGDFVRFTPEPQGGAIAFIEERFSFLARTEIRGKKEQLIAVNIDQVIITMSFSAPPLKPPLVDRYLIAAAKGNLHPILVINKIDLLKTAPLEEKKLYQEFLIAYENLGFPILSVSAESGVGIEALKSLLQGKTSVFSGQSGVGKSSLLNACFAFERKVGSLAFKTQKGSHTTTSAELIALPGGGYSVDTPGIRSFGIWNLQKEEITAHFSDFLPYKKECKYPNCMHRNEPSCQVRKALEKGLIHPLRYQSYQTLIEEIETEQKQTWN